MPSPDRYNPEPKQKIIGFYTSKEEGGNFSSDAEYQGQSTPAAYNFQKYELVKPRIIASQWKSKLPRIPKQELARSPSPDKYDTAVGQDKTRARARVVTLHKTARTSYLDRVVKEAKHSKGPGAYDIGKALEKVTLGARRGYK